MAHPVDPADPADPVDGLDPAAPAAPVTAPAREYRAPRSARGTASALVALVVLAGAGALLYDVIAVRNGHRAGTWRTWVAHQLATRHPDAPWMLGAAALAAVLGCRLCWLAVRPGGRRWLALGQAPRTAIERAGVAALLEARTRELTMVAAARARVSRRRARVTVFGSADLGEVRRVLTGELEGLALVRPLRLTVRGRPARHRPHVR